ncbi:hypothetical protein MUG78_17435 [Gordonia alkaliphila]|uniref:hypothetical protein n=1 Tax=Gordonia alkaliphila TaxID=1053547 RepID=UPI001FF51F67|nr:hypothetical protein [Gordonia alkaliphila]MCK0441184.1 hypothetical protein [Gordonia alkaliphila]
MTDFGGAPRTPDASDRGVRTAAIEQCSVYAHQSSHVEGCHTPDVVNVEIDAPPGVTVRIHLNDGKIYETVVPD